MNLNEAELGKEYVIKDVDTFGDDEMKSFLFSLGCFSGESITVVDKKKNLVLDVKGTKVFTNLFNYVKNNIQLLRHYYEIGVF